MDMINSMNDSIPVSITSRALTNNFSIEEKARREEAIKNKDFYYDKADKYIDQVTPDVDIATVNLVRVITKKRTSLLYNQNLVREYDGPQSSVDFLTNFYKYMNIDKFLYAVDIVSELTGTGLVHIKSSDNEYNIKLQLFDGSEISVLPTTYDPNEPDAVSLIRMYDRLVERNGAIMSERVLEQQIWTQTSVTTYTNGYNTNPILNNTFTHELPVMPFVAFKGEDVEGQYLGHSSCTSWRKLNDTYNHMLTHLGFMVKMESSSPIVLTGYESGEGIMVHPGRAINLPIGASANILSFNPKISDALETIKYIEDKIYDTSSVPKVTVIGGNASSGRELMIQWFPLLQVFKDKAVRYKRYEKQLADTILTLVGLPLINDINIHFPEESVLPLSTEEDNLQRDIDLNLKSPIDELMRRKPGLSEQEAEVEIRSNKSFNDFILNNTQGVNNV
jgi:hypothetical protein